MFEEWKVNTDELRRACMGKYILKIPDATTINFDDVIFKYMGPSICSNKFNFQVKGNKCHGCNTLSYLFQDGNIVFDTPLTVQVGNHKGEQIIISKYSKSQSYGKYLLDTSENNNLKIQIPQIDLCNNSFSSFFSVTKLINTDLEIYHYIAVSIMLNYIFGREKGQTNRFLSVYVCDNIQVVRIYPDAGIGTFNILTSSPVFSVEHSVDSVDSAGKKNLTVEVARGIFHQLILYFLFLLKTDSFFLHGSPSMEFLSFSSEPFRNEVNIGTGIFVMTSPVTLYIDPGKYSSVAYKNYTSKYRLVGVYDENELSNVTMVPISFYFSNNNSSSSSTICRPGISSNPCLPEYLKKRRVTYKLTHNIMSAVRNSGFPIFLSLDIYLFITTLLLEESFYIPFISDPKLSDILRKIILPNQFDMYISEIQKNHHNSTSLNADQIVDFIIGIELEMYCEIIVDIWSDIIYN